MAWSAAEPALTIGEQVAARGRAVTLGALLLLAALAWAYLLSGAAMAASGSSHLAAGIVMWWVMMVAMMIPAAAPTILLFARVHRHSSDTPPPTGAFLAGYLACWLGFSMIAALLEAALQRGGALVPMVGALRSAQTAGAISIAAGLYQLTSAKDSCLTECRSPAGFLSRHFRPGAAGALRLGLLHGAYCVGCCWLLMALLFVAGVMNLAFVAALTLLVAAEKLLPYGRALARFGGVLLLVAGVALLLR